MSLNPTLAVFLTPSKSTLLFAARGVIAMALALYVAMFLQLDRPYWALISAVFLQIRPETGLVIEKGVCQILGTLIGGAVGVAILAAFMPYPVVAIVALAAWIGLNAAASAMVRRLNLIYGFAIAGITAVLVVALTMVNSGAVDSQTVFQVATARVSEIVVGAVCATLVAMLLWPTQVREVLMGQAREAINQTLDYMVLEIASDSTHEQRHKTADTILQTVIALNDDSSAAVFEGPEGPGRARAVSRLCQKLLSLLAVIQVFGRLRRNHPELISRELDALLKRLSDDFQQIRRIDSEAQQARKIAQSLRRELQQRPRRPDEATPIQRRLFQTAREMIGDLIVVLQANRAIDNSDRTLLKARSLAPYRDPLIGAITGFRSAVVFLVGAGLWVATGSPTALLLMILPVIFSIMFARFPSPPTAMRRLLIGALIAIPVALVFGMGLLARASGSFELLVMIFGAPFFVGLMAIANLDTRPYGLGFAIPYILLIRPSNPMTFAVDRFASTALVLIVALGIVYMVFRLITAPSARLMQRRLIASTTRDLERLGQRGREDYAEDWFNARMAERLMRLSGYDRALPEDERHLADLGLTGLNLGHVSLRLQRQLGDIREPRVRALTNQWRQALAEAYLESSQGRQSERFRGCSARLLEALRQSEQIDDTRVELLEGMMERLALTFERIAKTVAEARDGATTESTSSGTVSKPAGA